jgi:hypothetical protein
LTLGVSWNARTVTSAAINGKAAAAVNASILR